ncbi:MAG: cysteine peptidase family C39 domain-containing protein [Candidatus Thiodiazotropha sp.]
MDTALHALIALARFHQLPAEPEQLAHQFGQPGQPFGDTQLLQAAKALTLRAKRLTPKLSEIQNAVLPTIAKLKDGSYIILAKIASHQDADEQAQGVLVHDLRENRPKNLTQTEFEEIWSGELILMTRR